MRSSPPRYATEREFHEAELARFRAAGMKKVPPADELATKHDDYLHGLYDVFAERFAAVAAKQN